MGEVCPWCGRTFAAAVAVVRTARAARWRWIPPAVVGVGGLIMLLVRFGVTPLAVTEVQRALPDLVGRIEGQGHKCRWTVRDAAEPGREGWQVVQCLLDGGGDGPAWYLARTRAAYAKNAAARIWSKAPEPPEIPAWTRPGVTCSMSDYYDDCMVGIVIDKVRPVSRQGLAELQEIADKTLSFAPGHSRQVAEKVHACGVASADARCGQFGREMAVIEEEVIRQLAAQRSR